MTFMRTYETTHPWLSFELDLTLTPATLWLLLGRARSACDLIVSLPLLPAMAAEIDTVYLVKGARGTTAISGDSLSEGEVRDLIDGQLQPAPSKAHLHQETRNVIEAFRSIRTEAEAEVTAPLTPERICAYNRLVLRDTEQPVDQQPGEVRRFAVAASRHAGAPAEDCEYLLGRLCDWLGRASFAGDVAAGQATPIIKAIIAHLYLAWIHPFADGNGRTARLTEHVTLLEAGFPAAAAHLLTNHYFETQARYNQELDRASKHWGSPLTFLQYAVEGFVDQLEEQLAFVRAHQLSVCWRDFVNQSLSQSPSLAEARRRELALAIFKVPGGASLENVAGLSPRLAVAYSRRSRRTLLRDLETCQEHGLVGRTVEGRYVANLDVLLPYARRGRPRQTS